MDMKCVKKKLFPVGSRLFSSPLKKHPHLIPWKKLCVGPCMIRCSVSQMGRFSSFPCPATGGEVGVYEAEEKVVLRLECSQELRLKLFALEDEVKKGVCLERHPKLDVGDDVAKGREFEQASSVQAQIPIITRGSSNYIATFLRSLLQGLATAASCCCHRLLSRCLIFGDDSDHKYMCLDSQTPEPVFVDHMILAKKNDLGVIDDIFSFGDHVETAFAELIATAVEHVDDVVESVASNFSDLSVGNGIDDVQNEVDRGQDRADEGHDEADDGPDGPDEGHDGADGGQDGAEEGHDEADDGPDGPDEGHDGADGGQDGDEEGHDEADGGQDGDEEDHDEADDGQDEEEEVLDRNRAEENMTINIADPGEPPEILGGLSRSGYKHIVFSVCPDF